MLIVVYAAWHLCWVSHKGSLCLLSLCWVSLSWVPLCWMSWHLFRPRSRYNKMEWTQRETLVMGRRRNLEEKLKMKRQRGYARKIIWRYSCNSHNRKVKIHGSLYICFLPLAILSVIFIISYFKEFFAKILLMLYMKRQKGYARKIIWCYSCDSHNRKVKINVILKLFYIIFLPFVTCKHSFHHILF